MNQDFKVGRLLGFAGSAMGLLAGLALGSIRIGWINVNPGTEPRPDLSLQLPGSLGFLFASTMPFLLALIALLFRNPSWRTAIWLGAGLLALVVAMSPLSIAAFLLLPLPALLLIAGAVATWRAAGYPAPLQVLSVALGLAIMAGLAAVVLFSLPDASCWELIRSASGQETWQAIPYTTSLTLGPGTGVVASTCTTDIISPIEAAMSVGIWVITLIGLTVALPRALPSRSE